MAYILDDGHDLTISDKPLRMRGDICEVEEGAFHTVLSDEALRILTGCVSIAFGQCIPIHATIGSGGSVAVSLGEQA